MTFEDRLLTQLRAVVAENPAPAPKQRTGRRRLALSGAGLTTAAAAAVVLIAGGGASADPAYAVQKRSDGDVTVTVSSLRDASGLQEKLRAAGIPADVTYADDVHCTNTAVPTAHGGQELHSDVSQGPDAGPTLSTGGNALPAGAGGPMSSTVRGDGSATFTIDPNTIKQGDRLTIRASVGHLSSLTMAVGHGDQPLPTLPCPPETP